MSKGSWMKTSRFRNIMRELERGVLMQTLAETGWNITHAAKALGISRVTFVYHCKDCDVPLSTGARRNKKTMKQAAVIADSKL
jgi:DNA-binding NtrC family response regulator